MQLLTSRTDEIIINAVRRIIFGSLFSVPFILNYIAYLSVGEIIL
mgnify:CR=1 FL=1